MPGRIPDGFSFQLLDDDWDHFEQHMAQALERVPALENAGVKSMTNGPEVLHPRRHFMLGEAPEVAGFFVGAGFNAFGIAAGGGAGRALAEWVVHGEQPLDLWSVDIRRFSGLHRDDDWVRERTLEAYGKHYAMGFPHEEYVSGRPRLTSPLYDRMAEARREFRLEARLGAAQLVRAARREPAGRAVLRPGELVRRGRARTRGVPRAGCAVRPELLRQVRDLRQRCGASARLDLRQRRLQAAGRLTYTQMLNSRGGIECDLTVARLDEDRFYLVTGTGFRTHDAAWIRQNANSGADVVLDDVTEQWGTLSLFGPEGARHAGRGDR